ncbi:MAG: glutathione S-transferase family protein [Bradyrhizobium sp.]|nr:glutathione S-transferase family protein [Bradyrhizobium sp.]
MTLVLYFHPLSSFCQKALVALYENGTPFEPRIVDLSDEASRAAFLRLWPIGKFPVLRDEARDRLVPESSVIIEYLDRHYPGPAPLMPADPDLALKTRLADRFYDLYVHEPMQKIVGDRLRPASERDAFGVAQAKARLQTAYAMIDAEMATQMCAAGETFTLADCAAAPALFYGRLVLPFGDAHLNLARYFARLMDRPSFARAVAAAKPYFGLFPQVDAAA